MIAVNRSSSSACRARSAISRACSACTSFGRESGVVITLRSESHRSARVAPQIVSESLCRWIKAWLRRLHSHRAHPRPIETFEQRRELGGREPHNTVTDRRPAERAFLQPLGDEHKTGAVPQQQLHAIARSHVILHTDRNLLSFTIVGIRCMGSGCAYDNDQHDGVNRLFILRSALTSHGRFPCGCATRRYARRCPWDRRRYRSTR